MSRRQNPGKNRNLSQFGLLDVPDLEDGDHDMDLSDDDLDFEAELAALSGGGGKKPRARKLDPVVADLDAMIAASLRDIPSDDEGSGADDDDPDLLSELNELAIDDEDSPPSGPPRTSRPAPAPPSAPSAPTSTVSLLQDRISNYTLAEKTAKEKGESSRARRFGRGLKTLNDLLKQAKAGKQINDADIPPPVAMGVKSDPTPSIQPSAPVQPSPPEDLTPPEEPSPPPVPPRRQNVVDSPQESSPEPVATPPPPPVEALSPERQQGLQFILNRQHELKAAALASKQAGDKQTALEYLKVVKQFDIVVDAYKSGQEMDLNELPTVEAIAATLRGGKEENSVENSTDPSPAPVEAPGLITASSLDEALKQRLAYFQKQEAKAKEEGNSSKARRMGRIVKQYVDAVKLNASGRPVPVDELPPAPGHAPLNEFSSPTSHPSPAPHPAAPSTPSPAPSAPSRPTSTRYEKQLAFLLLRQKQFKEAAIKAKKEGNIAQAKEYLRSAKGFDSLIESARGGLAVDLKSLPLPPKEQDTLEHAFEEVSKEDCDPSPTDIRSSDDDVTSRIHSQLASQLKMCRSNMEHYNAMGNIAEMNRYQQLAASVKQDMDLCALAVSVGRTPKFHYETRKFSIVQCNTDLNENDLELQIVRGISYTVPNPREIDTYVKFEFGYPPEAPVSDRTVTVKDTNSPVYEATFPLSIQRSSRACQRYFKRHGIKLEVYSKGGWFRSDALVGVVNVKLAPLETQVTIHEAFPLMDGRRPAGGSLEVKIRVRTPLVQQQIEHTQQRWLVIDD